MSSTITRQTGWQEGIIGDHDTVLPFLGTQTWVRSLNYPIVDDWRAWHVDGQSAGFTVAYGNNLTFATVKVDIHQQLKFDHFYIFKLLDVIQQLQMISDGSSNKAFNHP
uniref:Uncharacterized protein n=1 Tax=Oryza punctata TaxID=4537 RepID=A0A0E0MF40_ORYPU